MPREFKTIPKLHSVNDLRANVDKLFSPAYGASSENGWWNGMLLGKSTDVVIELKHVPQEAINKLAAGRHKSLEYATFAAIRHRQTKSKHLFGKTAVTHDIVICALGDEAPDTIANLRGFRGKIYEPIFDYTADMTQPSIPYDERLDGFVNVCLERMQEAVKS